MSDPKNPKLPPGEQQLAGQQQPQEQQLTEQQPNLSSENASSHTPDSWPGNHRPADDQTPAANGVEEPTRLQPAADQPTNHYGNYVEGDYAATRLERPVQGYDPERKSVDETLAWSTAPISPPPPSEKPSKWLLIGIAALSLILGLLLGYLMFHPGGPLDGSSTNNTVGINSPPESSPTTTTSIIEPTTTSSTSTTSQPMRTTTTTRASSPNVTSPPTTAAPTTTTSPSTTATTRLSTTTSAPSR